jgi:hypothetical protein
MARDGRRSPPRPRISVPEASATPEEAAAIAAAIEQFLRDTAPRPAPGVPARGAWARTAILEAAGAVPGTDPWGDPERWGA